MKKRLNERALKKMDDLFAIFDCVEESLPPIEAPYTCASCGSEDLPVSQKGDNICSNCGYSEHVQQQVKSWSAQHQERRRSDTKDLFSDIAGKGFSDNIARTANDIFALVISGKTRRSASRIGIVCGCLFDSYKINSPQHQMALDYSIIYNRFNIGRKAALKGLKEVTLCLSIHHRESEVYMRLAVCNFGAREFINNYMSSLTAQKGAAERVCSLFSEISRFEHLGRSRPQAVAAGIVYYWIKEENKQIALDALVQLSGLKKNTIEKMESDIRKRVLARSLDLSA